MTDIARRLLRPLILGTSLVALAACDNGLDWDLRSRGDGLSTAEAARQATAPRPQPDARGVISYPGYQVVVAQSGDTVSGVASRLGLNRDELARYNALPPETELRQGEVLALPARVTAAPSGGMSTASTATGGIDVAAIATTAIDRAGGGTAQPAAQPSGGPEPIRHQVVRGETAFSIARLYNVTTRSLSDWNGLGSEMNVREGQVLMIPVAAGQTRTAAAAPPPQSTNPPGTGSATPTPPSASQPLPQDDPATAQPASPPPSPDLGAERTETAASSGGVLAYPVRGNIIREYQRGRNDGISISAAAGTPVLAAADGTVAAITQDTDQMPIMVIRHADNLLTVYANIDSIQVARGAQVRRGDTIASVRAGDPAFIHFEVRQGFDSVDPMNFLR